MNYRNQNSLILLFVNAISRRESNQINQFKNHQKLAENNRKLG